MQIPRQSRFSAGRALLAAALVANLLATLPAGSARAQSAPPQTVVDAAVQDLAVRTNVSPDAIELLRSEPVTWSDGCLGAASPGEFCTQALVDGWVLWLSAGGNAYRYHTDTVQTVRFAAGPMPIDMVDSAPLPGGGTPRSIDGLPPAGGVAIVTWPGGSIDSIEGVPPGATFWVTDGGRLVGYVPGAPDFVNADFRALYLDGQIPGGTPVMVVVPRPPSGLQLQ